MSADTNNNFHHITSCQGRLPTLPPTDGLICSLHSHTLQNPYILTFGNQHRRSPFVSKDLNTATQSTCKYLNSFKDIQRCRTIPLCPYDPSKCTKKSTSAALMTSDLYNIKYQHYEGYKVVIRQPKQHCARMTFKSEINIDKSRQQQPTPSDISSRYRSVHPHFFRNISNQMWRNPDKKSKHQIL